MNNRIALLKTIPLFEGLSVDDLEALASTVLEQTFIAGEIIFHQGDKGHEMYIIAEGDVNIFLPGEESRRISLKDIQRGEYFGELSLFDDKPRSASALSTTPSIVLKLTRDMLQPYLSRRPQAAMAILRTMSQRLRETNAMLSQRVAKNPVEEIEKNLKLRDKIADKVAELNGSWSFLGVLCVITIVWSVVNGSKLSAHPFDPYPYQFYNLALAILVSLQGPLIVMSQNRQAIKDRKSAEIDFKVNLKNEVNIESILRELGEFRAEANTRLERLERQTGTTATNVSIQPHASQRKNVSM